MKIEKMEEVPEEVKERIAEEMWEKGKDAFQKAREAKEVNKAWKMASEMAETYLKKCLRTTGEKVEEDMERGGTANLATQTISAETKKGEMENKQRQKKKVRKYTKQMR